MIGETTERLNGLRAPLLVRHARSPGAIAGVGPDRCAEVGGRADHTGRAGKASGHRIHRQARRASGLYPHRGSRSRRRRRAQGGVLHATQQPVHGARRRRRRLGNPRALALVIVDAPLPSGLTALAIDANARLEGEEAIIGHWSPGRRWQLVCDSGKRHLAAGPGGLLCGPVDKGNSGGPLLHTGKVVGIVTNKGPTFGEAVAASIMVDFLAGSGIDIGPPAAAAAPAPSPAAAVARSSACAASARAAHVPSG